MLNVITKWLATLHCDDWTGFSQFGEFIVVNRVTTTLAILGLSWFVCGLPQLSGKK